MIENVKFHWDNVTSAGTGRLAFLREKTQEALRRGRLRSRRLLAQATGGLDASSGAPFAYIDITRVNDEALMQYKPSAFSGKITLFRPKKTFDGFDDPVFGWGEIAREGVEVCELDVNPRGMLVEPYVQQLAEQMRRRVKRIS